MARIQTRIDAKLDEIYSEKDKLADAEFWESAQAEKWNNILMDFGESCSSWYLETDKKVVFVVVRWAIFPLKVLTGIDLVGYCVETKTAYVAESKCTGWKNVSKPLTDMTEQLSYEKLELQLNDPLSGYGSFGWLAGALLEAGRISEEDVSNITDRPNLIRCGFLFHPRRETPVQYDEAISKLVLDSLPIEFTDNDLEDFNSEIASFVDALKSLGSRVS